MQQLAPEPLLLKSLVERLRYKAGWYFSLEDIDRGQGSKGLTLVIYIVGPDTNDPQRNLHVNHYMIVPAACYNEQSWQRWLFEQVLLVERHEAAEFFRIDEVQPFAPNHSPGNDPYLLFELTTADVRQTNFRGERVG